MGLVILFFLDKWIGCHKSYITIAMNVCAYVFRWRRTYGSMRQASCDSRYFGYHWMVRQVQMNIYASIFISLHKSDL